MRPASLVAWRWASGLRDGLAEVLLGVGLHLGERHGRDLLGGELLAVDHDDATTVAALLDLVRHGLELVLHLGELAAHGTLDGEHGVLGVGDGLVLGGLTHDAVAVGAEAHDGRGGAVALGVHDGGGGTALENRHGGVGGAQVETENLAHDYFPSLGCVTRMCGCPRRFGVWSWHSVSPYDAPYTKSKSIHIRFPILHIDKGTPRQAAVQTKGSRTAMAELVVPRSIPRILLMITSLRGVA